MRAVSAGEETAAPKERSTCGWRHRLISREDTGDVAAWAHAVDIDGAKPHYHKIGTELYYVLDGEGSVVLDGVVEHVDGVTNFVAHRFERWSVDGIRSRDFR